MNYGYADGTANTIRRTSITYPNGRVLNIEYATGTEDDTLSRVTRPGLHRRFDGRGPVPILWARLVRHRHLPDAVEHQR